MSASLGNRALTLFGVVSLCAGAARPHGGVSRQAACAVGGKIDVAWHGVWYPATIKAGPNAAGACQIGYDGYGSNWDEWVGADRMRRRGEQKAAPGAAAAAATALTPEVLATMPPLGVYYCRESFTTYNAPGCTRTAVGCIGWTWQLRPVVMVGLIDRSTYSDYDGHTGHYAYDGRTGVLSLTDGAKRGWRYQRTHSATFQMLNPDGTQTVYECPLEPNRDPRRHPW